MAIKNFKKAGREKTALAASLDKLAASIVKDVEELDLEVKLLAMRTLTQYYSATTRAGDGDEQGLGFDAFRDKLAAASSGGGSAAGAAGGPELPSDDPKIVSLFARGADDAAGSGEGGEDEG